MTFITNRTALEVFEYDPYGFKPDWWLAMVVNGLAFEHEKHATFNNENGVQKADVGDRIYIDETSHVDVMKAYRFKRLAKPIDTSKDSASMFQERLEDAKHKLMEQIRAMRKQ